MSRLQMYLHSCLMSAMLIGWKGWRAAWYTCRMSLHTCLEMRVSGVVMRQNAARVFITGRGLPARIARPCAVARWRARCDLRRNSCPGFSVCYTAVDKIFVDSWKYTTTAVPCRVCVIWSFIVNMYIAKKMENEFVAEQDRFVLAHKYKVIATSQIAVNIR